MTTVRRFKKLAMAILPGLASSITNYPIYYESCFPEKDLQSIRTLSPEEIS
jgi:hypothetical protein